MLRGQLARGSLVEVSAGFALQAKSEMMHMVVKLCLIRICRWHLAGSLAFTKSIPWETIPKILEGLDLEDARALDFSSNRFLPQCPLGDTQEFYVARSCEFGWSWPSFAMSGALQSRWGKVPRADQDVQKFFPTGGVANHGSMSWIVTWCAGQCLLLAQRPSGTRAWQQCRSCGLSIGLDKPTLLISGIPWWNQLLLGCNNVALLFFVCVCFVIWLAQIFQQRLHGFDDGPASVFRLLVRRRWMWQWPSSTTMAES